MSIRDEISEILNVDSKLRNYFQQTEGQQPPSLTAEEAHWLAESVKDVKRNEVRWAEMTAKAQANNQPLRFLGHEFRPPNSGDKLPPDIAKSKDIWICTLETTAC
jgi:hypothetical protein